VWCVLVLVVSKSKPRGGYQHPCNLHHQAARRGMLSLSFDRRREDGRGNYYLQQQKVAIVNSSSVDLRWQNLISSRQESTRILGCRIVHCPSQWHDIDPFESKISQHNNVFVVHLCLNNPVGRGKNVLIQTCLLSCNPLWRANELPRGVLRLATCEGGEQQQKHEPPLLLLSYPRRLIACSISCDSTNFQDFPPVNQ